MVILFLVFYHHKEDRLIYEDSTWDVVGWQEFLLSIPEEYRTPEVVKQVKKWYHVEIRSICDYIMRLLDQNKPYYAYFSRIGVNAGSSQMIANFSVKDLTKQDDPNQVNWHLQNTSQWVYAGALVIDKYAFERKDKCVVSTHH